MQLFNICKNRNTRNVLINATSKNEILDLIKQYSSYCQKYKNKGGIISEAAIFYGLNDIRIEERNAKVPKKADFIRKSAA